MIELTLILVFLFGISLGFYLSNRLTKFNAEFQQNKIDKEIQSTYEEIKDNLLRGDSRFLKRLNNLIYIQTYLISQGPVEVVLNDRGEIHVFQNEKCLYTSSSLTAEFRREISRLILEIFKNEINDVIVLNGFAISKNIYKQWEADIDGGLGNQIERLKREIEDKTQSDIDKIVKENETKLDLDEILDKISNSGINSLSPTERKFLDDLSKEKGSN